MDAENLRNMLEELKAGERSVDEVAARLEMLPFEDMGFAKVDHHRTLRCGVPEVIFCEGKTTEQVRDIAERILGGDSDLLATRASREQFEAIQEVCPEAEYDAQGRCVTHRLSEVEPAGLVTVVTAGTSDLPVAREAEVTASFLGSRTELISDVGVAGIHRLFGQLERLRRANVLVVVAGMEGALASVVGGLVARPVIAVPTSVGYGASLGGMAPLLTMLNSCAAGVSVVNIDNGFGAGYVANLINSMAVGTAPTDGEKEGG
jgi:hypothetical protein